MLSRMNRFAIRSLGRVRSWLVSSPLPPKKGNGMSAPLRLVLFSTVELAS